MAVLNDRHKWLYVFEPHTASRATSLALKAQVPHTVDVSHHHATFRDIVTKDKYVPFKQCLGYDVICTVRNPFDVLVTGFHRENGGNLAFSEWLARMINAPRAQVPMHRGIWQDANTFCYYEHLAEDLPVVIGRPVQLDYAENHKTQNKRPWQEYFSLEQMNMLLMYWQPFLDHFGYYFDGDELVVDQNVRARRRKPVGQGRLLKSWRS